MELFSFQAPSSDLSKLADAAPFLEALYIAENLHLTLDYLCTEVCSKLTQLRFLCWAQREESEANNEVTLFSDFQAQKIFCESTTLFATKSVLTCHQLLDEAISDRFQRFIPACD